MSEIYFKIGADFEKVQLLRTKIDDLTEKLKNMDQATDPKGFRKLEKQLQTTTKEFNSLVSQAAIAGAQLKKANQDAGDSTKGFGDLNSVLMKIGGTAALTKLGSDIVQVRGEFQQLEIAFTTLLGSKEKSDTLMNQMVDTAMKTPYSLQGVASGARQLLAYGFAAENVNDVLVRLGNVASGLGLPLERLTYLYGTTRVQGRLYARDMLQFTSSGIPLLQKLADMYGVSTDKINDMVTAGKIGFSDVEKVFKSMTDQGGMFYNLMENQSKSFTGQISNIKDQLDKALNDFGKSNEDIINGGLSGVKTLIDNYETIGKVLVGLIATYGTYKTALVLNTIATNGLTTAETLWYTKSEAMLKMNALLKASMLTNPYVAVTVGVVALCSAIWVLHDSTTSAEKANKEYADTMDRIKDSAEQQKKSFESLIEVMRDETATTNKRWMALVKLQKLMPDVFKNLTLEQALRLNTVEATKKQNEQIEKNERIQVRIAAIQAKRKEQEAKQTYNAVIANRGNFTSDTSYQAGLERAKKNWDEATLYANKMEGAVAASDKMLRSTKKLDKAQPVIHDKKYYDDLKKGANEVLDSFDDIVLKKLQSGNFKGLSKSVVDSYKKAKSDIAKADSYTSIRDKSGKNEKAAAKAELEREVTAKKIQDLKDKQAREKARKSEDLQEQFKQSEIDKLKDGAEKTLAQLKLNHEKEMIELKRQREDHLQKKIDDQKAIFDANPKNKGKQFDPSKIKLSLGEDAAFDMLESNSRIKYQKDLADTYKNILSDYKTYSERRLEIQEDYDKKRKALSESGGTKENFDQLDYRESKDLEAVDLEFASQKETFSSMDESNS